MGLKALEFRSTWDSKRHKVLFDFTKPLVWRCQIRALISLTVLRALQFEFGALLGFLRGYKVSPEKETHGGKALVLSISGGRSDLMPFRLASNWT